MANEKVERILRKRRDVYERIVTVGSNEYKWSFQSSGYFLPPEIAPIGDLGVNQKRFIEVYIEQDK